MANETIGTITCGWCGTMADVRRASRGRKKLYVMCPACGQQWLNTEKGQDIILSTANIFGARAPEHLQSQTQEVVPVVVEVPVPEKKRGFFSIDI